jgi:hypothetical protein
LAGQIKENIGAAQGRALGPERQLRGDPVDDRGFSRDPVPRHADFSGAPD